MKKAILLIGLSLITLAGTPEKKEVLILPINEPIEPFESLWRATCIVESNNDPFAVNVKEKAFGIVQIRPILLKDYYQRTGIRYESEDCFSVEISKEIFMYYASKFHSWELERISKKWNGRGKSNIEYWQKVKKHL